MDIFNLLIGILLIIFCCIYLIYSKKPPAKDNILFASQKKINLGLIGLIMVGLFIIYKEISKVL
jgi:hypothetical protein